MEQILSEDELYSVLLDHSYSLPACDVYRNMIEAQTHDHYYIKIEPVDIEEHPLDLEHSSDVIQDNDNTVNSYYLQIKDEFEKQTDLSQPENYEIDYDTLPVSYIIEKSSYVCNCDKCDFKSGCAAELNNHDVIYDKNGPMQIKIHGDCFSKIEVNSDALPKPISVQSFPYFCGLCSFGTMRRDHLTRHMLLHMKSPILSNKSPSQKNCYQCYYCNAVFQIQSVFFRHVQTHWTVLYKCNLCPYQCRYERDMSYHVKEHH